MDSSLVAWITGIGAILSAAAGVALIVREFRNKQAKEIHRLDDQLDDTRNELVQYHLYVHELRATMADAGIQSTPHPEELLDQLAQVLIPRLNEAARLQARWERDRELHRHR